MGDESLTVRPDFYRLGTSFVSSPSGCPPGSGGMGLLKPIASAGRTFPGGISVCLLVDQGLWSRYQDLANAAA